MNTETALSNATDQAAEASGQQTTADQTAAPNPADILEAKDPNGAGDEGADDKGEGEGDKDPPKREKTPEEREIARLRRRVDNLTKRLYQGGQGAAQRSTQADPLATEAIGSDNRQQQADSEALTLSRAQLRELVKAEAEKLAPNLKQQRDEMEQRRASVAGLVKEWGQEKFSELTDDLAAVFDGDKQLAVLETENPRAVIEYLTDPDNATEAEAIERMPMFKAGRAIAAIERKLDAKKGDARPQPSKAAAPLSQTRGAAPVNGPPNPRDTKAWVKWANEQERREQR